MAKKKPEADAQPEADAAFIDPADAKRVLHAQIDLWEQTAAFARNKDNAIPGAEKLAKDSDRRADLARRDLARTGQ